MTKARIIENVQTNCIIFGETLRFMGKNLNKSCVKIVQKVLEWPLQCVNFQAIFGGARPRTPPQPFLFSIWFKIILPEKIRLKICENLVPPHRKKF